MFNILSDQIITDKIPIYYSLLFSLFSFLLLYYSILLHFFLSITTSYSTPYLLFLFLSNLFSYWLHWYCSSLVFVTTFSPFFSINLFQVYSDFTISATSTSSSLNQILSVNYTVSQQRLVIIMTSKDCGNSKDCKLAFLLPRGFNCAVLFAKWMHIFFLAQSE